MIESKQQDMVIFAGIKSHSYARDKLRRMGTNPIGVLLAFCGSLILSIRRSKSAESQSSFLKAPRSRLK